MVRMEFAVKIHNLAVLKRRRRKKRTTTTKEGKNHLFPKHNGLSFDLNPLKKKIRGVHSKVIILSFSFGSELHYYLVCVNFH